MVYSRAAAVSFLESCILNTCGDQNGLVVDDPDNDNVRVFIFNQCAIVATALKMVGSPQWPRVSARCNKWLTDYQSKINQLPVRNATHPILDQAAIPSQPSFLPNVDVFLLTGGPGTNTQPSQILTNTCPVDDLSEDWDNLSTNRGMLRCIHFQLNTGDTSRASSEWDSFMADRGRESNHALIGLHSEQTQYSTFMLMIQWIGAHHLGKSQFGTFSGFMDVMQQSDGRIAQFYTVSGGTTFVPDPDLGNTEGTGFAVIADVLINGP